MFLRLTGLLLISQHLPLRSARTRFVLVGFLPTARHRGVRILGSQGDISRDDRPDTRHWAQVLVSPTFLLLKLPIARLTWAQMICRRRSISPLCSWYPYQWPWSHRGWSGLLPGYFGFPRGCSGFRGGCSGFPRESPSPSRTLLVVSRPNWGFTTNHTRAGSTYLIVHDRIG